MPNSTFRAAAFWLTTSLLTASLLTAHLAAAQAPAAGKLQLAQSISLAATEALTGAVQLLGGRTALFIPSVSEPTVRVQCLGPDGRTSWTAKLIRHQSPTEFRALLDFSFLEGRQSKEEREIRLKANLCPLNVFTSEGRVTVAERLTEQAYKKMPKQEAAGLAAEQLWVQQLDERGQLTSVTFAPRPEPQRNRAEVEVVGAFAEGSVYAEIVSETFKDRAEEQLYFIDRYDLPTKRVSRQPLTLPKVPERYGMMSKFYFWYRDWAFLGHRANQNYLFRRSLATEANPKLRRSPLIYEFLVLDNQGGVVNSFSTTLGPPAGFRLTYSGRPTDTGELQHRPRLYKQTVSKNAYEIWDMWEAFAGGFGSPVLDYATGDVLVHAEYDPGEVPEPATNYELSGLLLRRYSAQGKLLAQADIPYTREMRKTADFEFSVRVNQPRTTGLSIDPVSGRLSYSFLKNDLRFGGIGYLSVASDLSHPVFTALREYTTKFYKRPFTNVYYAGPAYLNPTRTLHLPSYFYHQPQPADPPLYAELHKLRLAQPVDPDMFPAYQPYYFFLSATGPGQALVVEHAQLTGGKVRVFTYAQ